MRRYNSWRAIWLGWMAAVFVAAGCSRVEIGLVNTPTAEPSATVTLAPASATAAVAVVSPTGAAPHTAAPAGTNTASPTPPPPATATDAPSATPSSVPPTPLPPATYTVQRGDTLWSIARRFSTSVEALRAANGLTSDAIFAGQVLVLPGPLPPVTATPAAAPTTVPTLSAGAPSEPLQVKVFTVAPTPIERGGQLQVIWEVVGATQVQIFQLAYDGKTSRWYRDPAVPAQPGAAAGLFTVHVPADAQRPLRFELEARDAAGNVLTATGPVVEYRCHALFFNPAVATPCPLPFERVEGAWQAFEHGFMLWRSHVNQVYVLSDGGFWHTVPASPAPADALTPPAGLQTPGGHFRGAWLAMNPTDRAALGWATAPEQAYTVTTQLSLNMSTTGSATKDDLYVLWPDGRIAHLFVYLGAPNHDNGPSWHLRAP